MNLRWLLNWRTRPKIVSVDQCVHFCGFRYGCKQFNPYENYMLALASGESLSAARERFVDFLCGYRPRDLGQSLGLKLSRRYELWQFPWDHGSLGEQENLPGWLDDPDDVPDIMTHFSERGILRFRIEEEFLWAEKLFYSIRRHGFRARPSERPIEARKFMAIDGTDRYLLLDGNHRVSALVALDKHQVAVRYFPTLTVYESEILKWPRVKDGTFAVEDARQVFRAYFTGNIFPTTSINRAVILEINVPIT